MENLVLFAVTVFVYSTLWFFVDDEGPLPKWARISWKEIAILAALCLPLNINGHVFTVIGNAVGEKGVYSLASIYQKSGGKTFAVFGSGYQRAGNDAVTVFGLSGYQRAGNDAVTGVGLSGYQRAGNDAVTVFGLSGYQRADKNAHALIALAVYQQAGNKTRAFGAISPLLAE